MQTPKVLAVIGATASGKSALALALSQKLNAEILCMDSMQVYRHMNIGTAKPTKEEQVLVPHHLLDIVEPIEPFAVADYAGRAAQVISDVLSRGKYPLLVGGTGLYLKALMHGLALGGAKSEETLRAKYTALLDEENGKELLHSMLAQVDPPTAKRLHPNDIRRVIRALEICELTGKPMSAQQSDGLEQPFSVLPIGLSLPRDVLYARIEGRVGQMLRGGLLGEVDGLLKSGVPADAQAMQGIGYKELVPVLKGQCTRSAAVAQMILNTKHYSKKQCTWFKAEPAIQWFDAQSATLLDDAMQAAIAFFEEG